MRSRTTHEVGADGFGYEVDGEDEDERCKLADVVELANVGGENVENFPTGSLPHHVRLQVQNLIRPKYKNTRYPMLSTLCESVQICTDPDSYSRICPKLTIQK